MPADLVVDLEPVDIEWVRAEAARYQTARTLSSDEYRELVEQLAAIRRFDVLERQEPMTVQEQL